MEELERGCLGYAGLVYEHVLGEEKYTFVEDVRNPHSCTILVKGPSDYSLAQMKVPPCPACAQPSPVLVPGLHLAGDQATGLRAAPPPIGLLRSLLGSGVGATPASALFLGCAGSAAGNC